MKPRPSSEIITGRSLRMIGYVRVSTDEQATSGTSLDSQGARLKALAEAEGYEVVRIVRDEGLSGSSAERPGLRQVLSAVRSGEVDVLAVTSIDRLARKLLLMLDILQLLDEHNVAFRSLREGWDTRTPVGKFGLQLMGAAAELERGLIAERTKDGRARRRAEGKWIGGPIPYGYRRDVEGRFSVEDAEAAVVRHIFDIADTERVGVRELQKRLVGTPAPGGNGSIWAISTLERILASPIYAGRHPFLKDVPVLVAPAQFDRVQVRRRANHRLKPPVRTIWPLQGMMTCSCGGNWACDDARPGKGSRVYFCRNRSSSSHKVMRGAPVCQIPRQPAKELEGRIWLSLYATLSDPKALAVALDRSILELRANLGSRQEDAGRLMDEAEKVREELREVDRARIKRRLSDKELDGLEADALQRLKLLEGKIAVLDPAQLKELERSKYLLSLALNSRQHVGTGWDPFSVIPVFNFQMLNDDSDPDKWRGDFRRLLDRLDATVVVFPDHAEVRGLIPFTVANDASWLDAEQPPATPWRYRQFESAPVIAAPLYASRVLGGAG